MAGLPCGDGTTMSAKITASCLVLVRGDLKSTRSVRQAAMDGFGATLDDVVVADIFITRRAARRNPYRTYAPRRTLASSSSVVTSDNSGNPGSQR
jgi:hypothetical protein